LSIFSASSGPIAGRLVEVFPVQTDATFLPTGDIVEVDALLEQQFVLLADGQPENLLCCRPFIQSQLAMSPIAVSVEGVSGSILVPPTPCLFFSDLCQ
jgi:hypothetical protein